MKFNAAEFIRSYGTADRLPAQEGVELVFCGRSNVGKSSLINKLCRRKSLARVSSTPGKTTTINYFSLGGGVFLVDLPGYGYAKRSQSEKARWAALMQAFFDSRDELGLIVQLLDCRHAPSSEDRDMLEFIAAKGYPCLVVLTKTDKLTKARLAEQLLCFKELLGEYGIEGEPLPFTVNGEESAEALRTRISSSLEDC